MKNFGKVIYIQYICNFFFKSLISVWRVFNFFKSIPCRLAAHASSVGDFNVENAACSFNFDVIEYQNFEKKFQSEDALGR